MTGDERLTFLRRTALQLDGGGLLVGVDLKKDPAILRAAYNDAAGASAAFNTNILFRANRELNADFDLPKFRHRAEYNAAAGRMEIGIESLADQTVTIAGRAFRFGAGEIIDTQWAYKFTVEEFRSLGQQAGFDPREVWVDDQRLFSHPLSAGAGSRGRPHRRAHALSGGSAQHAAQRIHQPVDVLGVVIEAEAEAQAVAAVVGDDVGGEQPLVQRRRRRRPEGQEVAAVAVPRSAPRGAPGCSAGEPERRELVDECALQPRGRGRGSLRDVHAELRQARPITAFMR